jgi:hypothetical protein
MRFAQRGDDIGDAIGRDQRFHADFSNRFQPSRFANRWVRTFTAEECAHAGNAETARGILADMTGSGSENRAADGIDVFDRYERDELKELPACRSIGSFERPPIAHIEQIGQAIVGPADGGIKSSMRGIDAHSPANRGEHGSRRVKLPERLKNGRMIGNDCVALFVSRLGDDGMRHVDGEQNAIDPLAGISRDESDVVPRLGKPRRGDRLHGGFEVCDGGHDALMPRMAF